MKALEVNDVSKRFPGMEKLALNKVGFTLDQGECLGIVGGSGSGKSTLARVVTLLEQADCGSVSLFGKEILGLPRRQRKEAYSSIQMVFQMPLESSIPVIRWAPASPRWRAASELRVRKRKSGPLKSFEWLAWTRASIAAFLLR